jgi:hypothetical protein
LPLFFPAMRAATMAAALRLVHLRNGVGEPLLSRRALTSRT